MQCWPCDITGERFQNRQDVICYKSSGNTRSILKKKILLEVDLKYFAFDTKSHMFPRPRVQENNDKTGWDLDLKTWRERGREEEKERGRKGGREKRREGGRSHLRVLTRVERSREKGSTLSLFPWALCDLCPWG